MNYRPLRPFFYKPVAILGVPLRDWKISLVATVFSAVILFFVWNRFYGIPIWFVLSLAIGLGFVSFFLWAHNTKKRGWIEYSISYYARELTGNGQNLTSQRAGRKKTEWLLDDEMRAGKNKKTASASSARKTGKSKDKLKWLERA